MKINRLILIFIISTINMLAYTINIKDKIPNMILKNQFNTNKKIPLDTKLLIITFDQDISNMVIDFLKNKNNFLSKNKIVYIKRPFLINVEVLQNLFKNYSLKSLDFDILTLSDTYINLFKEKRDFITIYELNSHIVKNLIYLKTKEDLEEFFN